jgi:gamma-glutamylcyclotransferase (GGCT)/AIG2-like uncharacterized protein YtfP
MGDLLRENARYAGEASIRARLYIIRDPDDPVNTYPGAVPTADPADHLYGELYEITGDTARLYAVLDRFEGCSPDWPEPHEFLRRNVEVELMDGQAAAAIAYLYTWDVSLAKYVASGRYTNEHVGRRH